MTLIGTSDTIPNKLALEEVIQVISLNNTRHMKTSLKSLQDKFAVAPYGFDVKDVQWLVAMLFKMGKVSYTYNRQTLTLLNNSKEEIIKYITKREFVEKLLIDIKEHATDGQIKSAKEVMKDYFGFNLSSDDDEVIMRNFKKRAKDKLEEYNEIMVEYRINPKLPGKSLMESAKKNLDELVSITEPMEFFKNVDRKRDDLLDNAEDTAPVFDFFNGEQKAIFEKALKYIQMFEDSKTYVREQGIIDNVEKMVAIINSKTPYNQIQKLPEMCEKFVSQYGELLDKEAREMEPILADDYKKVMDELASKPFADKFRTKFAAKFEELKKKLETSHEIASVKNIRLESDTLKLRCLDEITEYEATHQPTPTDVTVDVAPTAPATKPKKCKNISISTVAGARTYTIENEKDIDNFLSQMKQKLMKELETDTIITLS
jgi:hypothetical protein